MTSVVIPTFNRSKLLVHALESVLKQTYDDYEVIVVDDGSTDDTRRKLEPYNERIRYFYQDNRGASAAQNKGISLAKGEWISVLASDDEWLPTKLERQFEALGAFGADFGACFTDCWFAGNPDMRKTAFETGGLERSGSCGILDNPTRYVLARNPVIWAQSLIVRRSLLDDLGRFDESMVVGEDTDLIFRLTLKTKFCFVSEPLVTIDRTPSRSLGLMELFYAGDDRAFSSTEHMFWKWLRSPELVDPQVRSRITDDLLRGLYYDWAVRKLYEFSFCEAFAKARRLRQIGDGNVEIFSKLASRAARKVCRSLARQSSPA